MVITPHTKDKSSNIDSRHFGCLPTEDFQYVPPYMKNILYCHILKVVDGFKGKLPLKICSLEHKITVRKILKIRKK